MTDWEWLIERCADGLLICNCKQAYSGLVEGYKDGNHVMCIGCPNGCSANQLNAKDHVAKEMRKVLG